MSEKIYDEVLASRNVATALLPNTADGLSPVGCVV
jgi:hypothetical protein